MQETIQELIATHATGVRRFELQQRMGGVAEQTLGSWIRGKRTPGLDQADRIARGLGVPVERVEAAITFQLKHRGRAIGPVQDVEARLAIVEADVQALKAETAGMKELGERFGRALDRLEASQKTRKQGARNGR